MHNKKNKQGFAPVITFLIIAAIAGFGFGAYRLSQSPPTNFSPQRIVPTEIPDGENTFEQETAEQKGVEASPTLGIKPLSIEEEKVQMQEEAFGVNFSREGNLVKQSGSWYILYDTPGNPAMTNQLQFTSTSKCDMGQGEGPCDANTFTQGDRVNVSGNEQQTVVTVSLMKKL